MMTAPAGKNSSERAYGVLKEMIADSRFLPGTRLHAERPSRGLQEGILVSVPNRGAFIADVTPQEAIETYLAREVLGGLAAKQAAARGLLRSIRELAEGAGFGARSASARAPSLTRVRQAES